MTPELESAFDLADAALFELHQRMERALKGYPGAENWREVFAMRVTLKSARRMVENNFKRSDKETEATGK